MEALLIHPENKEQLTAVKAFLKAMKVPFQQQDTNLQKHVQERCCPLIRGETRFAFFAKSLISFLLKYNQVA
jgi:hypothetical protein